MAVITRALPIIWATSAATPTYTRVMRGLGSQVHPPLYETLPTSAATPTYTRVMRGLGSQVHPPPYETLPTSAATPTYTRVMRGLGSQVHPPLYETLPTSAATPTYMRVMSGCSGREKLGPMSREHPWVTSCTGWPNRGRTMRLPLLVMQARRRPSAVQAMSATQ